MKKNLILILAFLLSVMCGMSRAQQTDSPYTNLQWKLSKPLYPACKSGLDIQTVATKCTVVTRDVKGNWIIKNWWFPAIDPTMPRNQLLSPDTQKVPATTMRPNWDQLRTLLNMRKLTDYFREQL